MNNPNNPSNPYTPNTTSLDLPPALASILSMGNTSQAPMAPASAPSPGLASGMMGQQVFSYEQGGMVGMGGMPEPMGMPPGGMASNNTMMPPPGGVGLAPEGQGTQQMTPQMLEMQVNQFASQNPQQVEGIRVAIQQVMQSGELTQQELNMVVQLATVAAQNTEMYPYVRNFAIQQGIATEQDLPPQYDQGLVFVLLLAARAMQQDMGGQDMVAGGTPAMAGNGSVSAAQVSSGAIPSMARGGMTPDSRKADGSVLINAHEGEFVVPANVVKMKGKEFFDNLVEKYKES